MLAYNKSNNLVHSKKKICANQFLSILYDFFSILQKNHITPIFKNRESMSYVYYMDQSLHNVKLYIGKHY